MFIESLEICISFWASDAGWLLHDGGRGGRGGRAKGRGEAGGAGRWGLTVGPVGPHGWPVGGDPR